MGISVFPAPSAGGKTTKGQVFNTSGNFTVPSNVNYITVNGSGGGGGAGGFSNYNSTNDAGSPGGAGGISSFGNLVSIQGGTAGQGALGLTTANNAVAGVANSGQGALAATIIAGNNGTNPGKGSTGTYKEVTVEVTPATTYVITIGAGGNAGNGNTAGAAGGSGWLAVEYEE